MKVLLVTPAPQGSHYGNRRTALRWARLLRSLGHRVEVETGYAGQRCDVLVALHARRSAEAMQDYKEAHPERPLVLALTGTDVYQDLPDDESAQRSVALADRIVTLQPLARDELPEAARAKVVSIIQSATPTPGSRNGASRNGTFDVCVIGHLRPVKDPFRAAIAARLLPASSRIRIVQVGGAMTPAMERRALAEAARNPRYLWLGEAPPWKTRRIMKRSQIMVVSSRLEGGANVVSEALADGVPVIGSRIPGNVGLLGEAYPGYYPTADTRALRSLLLRAENDPSYLQQLQAHTTSRADMVRPERERASWAALLRDLMPD